MTINEAIAQVQRIKPNVTPTDVLIGWLLRVDKYVYEEIMRGREGFDNITFEQPYTVADGEKTLLVPPPYDELYMYYLEGNICYEERELRKQANAMALYNESMHAFAKKYMRDHKSLPLPPTIYY